MMTKAIGSKTGLILATAMSASAAWADADKALTVYSDRHHRSDEMLYNHFTKLTGIKVNRIEVDDNTLLERFKTEGQRSTADIILMSDVAGLARAQEAGLFQPVKSPVLNRRIPAKLRSSDSGGGSEWFGFSTRARVIVYNKDKVNPKFVQTYESLADPRNKGLVCTRPGAYADVLSLTGSLIARNGVQATEAWAKGVMANLARSPQGGDTDQIRAVSTGECGVALVNAHDYARMAHFGQPANKAITAKVRFVWPDQASDGVHLNVAGGGVARYAPHRAAAVKFLEYLASYRAQVYFANDNNEWPAAPSVKIANPTLESLGLFRAETVPLATIADNLPEARRILERAGYQ